MPGQTPHDLPEELAPLGIPTRVFHARRTHTFLYLAGGICSILMGIAFAALLLTRPLWQPPGGKPHDPADLVYNLGLGLLLVIGGVFSIFRARKTGGQRVFIFADGLARLEGGKADALYWNEVRLVRWDPDSRRNDSTLTTPVQVVVEQVDGPSLVFNETIAHLRELREAIEEHTLPHLLPESLQALRAGSRLSFGTLGVSNEGFHDRARELPWDKVGSTEVTKGVLVIRERGTRKIWGEFPRSRVPNLHVLVALIDQVRSAVS